MGWTIPPGASSPTAAAMDNSKTAPTAQIAGQIVALIAAVGRNGEIGRDNALLWRLPEDMAYFKQTTLGRPVIMGRKTWESLPERFRPLPGRLNVVVSRNRDYAAPGATLCHSLEEALAAAGSGEVFVMGGAELYTLALPRAHRLYLTRVEDAPAADAFFPAVPAGEWQETRRQAGTGSEPAYAFTLLERHPSATVR